MMGYYGNMIGGFGTVSFLGLLTWLLVVVFLALGSVYFWQEINKKK